MKFAIFILSNLVSEMSFTSFPGGICWEKGKVTFSWIIFCIVCITGDPL